MRKDSIKKLERTPDGLFYLGQTVRWKKEFFTEKGLGVPTVRLGKTVTDIIKAGSLVIVEVESYDPKTRMTRSSRMLPDEYTYLEPFA